MDTRQNQEPAPIPETRAEQYRKLPEQKVIPARNKRGRLNQYLGCSQGSGDRDEAPTEARYKMGRHPGESVLSYRQRRFAAGLTTWEPDEVEPVETLVHVEHSSRESTRVYRLMVRGKVKKPRRAGRKARLCKLDDDGNRVEFKPERKPAKRKRAGALSLRGLGKAPAKFEGSFVPGPKFDARLKAKERAAMVLTPKVREKVLDGLSRSLSRAQVCQLAGIDTVVLRRFMKRNEEFGRQVLQVEQLAKEAGER